VYYISWTNKVGHSRKQVLRSRKHALHRRMPSDVFLRRTSAAAMLTWTTTSTPTGSHTFCITTTNTADIKFKFEPDLNDAYSNFGIYNAAMVLSDPVPAAFSLHRHFAINIISYLFIIMLLK
jgi:hypothetical protein